MVLTLKVKVKVKEVKVQNLIVSILGKDETCLKFWTKLHQNCNFELQGQIQGQGQGGQGPKFNHFYSRQRRNLSEIFNGIEAKLWTVGCFKIMVLTLKVKVKVKKVKVQNLIISILG